MLRVVRMIVDQCHGADPVKTLYEHTFWVEISKSKRTCNLSHANLSSELSNSIEQCCRHLHIVDEIKPAETDLLDIP